MPKAIDIKKREREIIRVALREYRGNDYVDIRQYYKSFGEDFLPTKRGISFNPELIDEVIKAYGQ